MPCHTPPKVRIGGLRAWQGRWESCVLITFMVLQKTKDAILRDRSPQQLQIDDFGILCHRRLSFLS